MENEANKMQFRPLMLVFSLLLALTLVVSAIPQASVTAQANCKVQHTVVAGDTLSYVANLYQVTWEEIAKENNLQPPYVITTGTVLCIPDGTATSTGSTSGTPTAKKDGKTPVLEVSPSFNSLHINVENFVAKTPYYVRVHPRSTGVSYRIGNFTTDKSGDFADWFRLPNYVPYSLDMDVCVKNTWTDAVSCVKLSNVTPFVQQLLLIRCSKEGR